MTDTADPVAKKKAKRVSTTKLSIDHLRDQGWVLVEKVERYNAFTKRYNDLFGFGDIIALRPGEVLLVQSTVDRTGGAVAARVRKIAEHENVAAVREAGIAIHVHGWFKKDGRWQVRVVDCS